MRCLSDIGGCAGVWHEPLYYQLQDGDCAVLDTVVREAETCGADTVLLSYEGLSVLGGEQIRWFTDVFDDVTAVVFLRRQDQLVNSFHNHLHKVHRAGLAEIEAYERSMLDYDTECDYRRVLERWAGALGHERLRPVVHDRSRSSVREFFGRAAMSVDYAGYVDECCNTAVDAFGLSVMRRVNGMAAGEQELRAIMNEAHRALSAHFVDPAWVETRYTLILAMRRKIMDHYRRSNEWTRKHFFPERPTLFPELEPGASGPSTTRLALS